MPADFRGQRLRVGGGPARNRDLGDALGAQVLGGQRADFAGADDQHASSLQTAENLPRELHRREADRHRAFAEGCFAADALADVERPVKELPEHRAGAAPFRRRLERILDLTQDLRFADDQRVQAGRDAEEMLRDVGFGERKQMRREALGWKLVVLAEKPDDLVPRRLRRSAGDVDLRAVARRQDNGLGRRRSGGERHDRRTDIATREVELLPEIHGCRPVTHAEQEQMHRRSIAGGRGSRNVWLVSTK